jgi:hypothetical protein
MDRSRVILLLRAESERHIALAKCYESQAVKDGHKELAAALVAAADWLADMMIAGGGA